jgi:hypothetical protein
MKSSALLLALVCVLAIGAVAVHVEDSMLEEADSSVCSLKFCSEFRSLICH